MNITNFQLLFDIESCSLSNKEELYYIIAISMLLTMKLFEGVVICYLLASMYMLLPCVGIKLSDDQIHYILKQVEIFVLNQGNGLYFVHNNNNLLG